MPCGSCAREQEIGLRQFLVQDPDGCLLRLTSDLGTRPFGFGRLSPEPAIDHRKVRFWPDC
jgi:hypothetical protein